MKEHLQCRIYPLNELKTYKYVVVCSYFNGKLILSKHKDRDTWETQGGHIEPNEVPIDTARRELYEESGIIEADIYPVCDYCGYTSKGSANGMVFLAKVRVLNALPSFEMKEIKIFDTLPPELTYPYVTPFLFKEAAKLLNT